MDEIEKAELSKQKKLVDCIEDLNLVLIAFTRLENYKEQLLATIEGFDLIDGDTYLELTQNLRYELLAIAFFAQSAAEDLAVYRQLSYPKQKIESVKQQKIRNKFNSQFASERLQDVRAISGSQQSSTSSSEARKQKSMNHKLIELNDELEQTSSVIRKMPQQRNYRLDKIESQLTRLQWVVLLVFCLQIGIFLGLIVFIKL